MLNLTKHSWGFVCVYMLLILLLNVICIIWSLKGFKLPYCIQMWCLQRNVTLHHSTRLLFMPLPDYCQKRLVRNVWFSLENEHSFPSGLASLSKTVLHKAADFCGCFGLIWVRSCEQEDSANGQNCCIFKIFCAMNFLFAGLLKRTETVVKNTICITWDSCCICLTIMLMWFLLHFTE